MWKKTTLTGVEGMGGSQDENVAELRFPTGSRELTCFPGELTKSVDGEQRGQVDV